MHCIVYIYIQIDKTEQSQTPLTPLKTRFKKTISECREKQRWSQTRTLNPRVRHVHILKIKL